MDQFTATQLWQEFQDGARSVIDQVDSEHSRLLLTRKNAGRAPRLTKRERRVVEYASLGYTNKAIGYELGIASSTVSTHFANAAAKLGVESRAAIIQMRCALDRADASVRYIDDSGEKLAVLSLPLRPSFPDCLSPAEREVAALVIAGNSNAKIAAARGLAERTIANQVVSAMRKVGAGSRTELITILTRSK